MSTLRDAIVDNYRKKRGRPVLTEEEKAAARAARDPSKPLGRPKGSVKPRDENAKPIGRPKKPRVKSDIHDATEKVNFTVRLQSYDSFNYKVIPLNLLISEQKRLYNSYVAAERVISQFLDNRNNQNINSLAKVIKLNEMRDAAKVKWNEYKAKPMSDFGVATEYRPGQRGKRATNYIKYNDILPRILISQVGEEAIIRIKYTFVFTIRGTYYKNANYIGKTPTTVNIPKIDPQSGEETDFLDILYMKSAGSFYEPDYATLKETTTKYDPFNMGGMKLNAAIVGNCVMNALNKIGLDKIADTLTDNGGVTVDDLLTALNSFKPKNVNLVSGRKLLYCGGDDNAAFLTISKNHLELTEGFKIVDNYVKTTHKPKKEFTPVDSIINVLRDYKGPPSCVRIHSLHCISIGKTTYRDNNGYNEIREIFEKMPCSIMDEHQYAEWTHYRSGCRFFNVDITEPKKLYSYDVKRCYTSIVERWKMPIIDVGCKWIATNIPQNHSPAFYVSDGKIITDVHVKYNTKYGIPMNITAYMPCKGVDMRRYIPNDKSQANILFGMLSIMNRNINDYFLSDLIVQADNNRKIHYITDDLFIMEGPTTAKMLYNNAPMYLYLTSISTLYLSDGLSQITGEIPYINTDGVRTVEKQKITNRVLSFRNLEPIHDDYGKWRIEGFATDVSRRCEYGEMLKDFKGIITQSIPTIDIGENPIKIEAETLINCAAGAGKTYAINEFINNNPDKKILVVAPSNMAARLIQGKTLHKTFNFTIEGEARLNFLNVKADFIIIDEVFLASEVILKQILLIKCPMCFLGDSCQLNVCKAENILSLLQSRIKKQYTTYFTRRVKDAASIKLFSEMRRAIMDGGEIDMGILKKDSYDYKSTYITYTKYKCIAMRKRYDEIHGDNYENTTFMAIKSKESAGLVKGVIYMRVGDIYKPITKINVPEVSCDTVKYGYDADDDKIDIINAKIINCHKTQGMTVEGLIYIDVSKEVLAICEKNECLENYIYTSITRTTNINNLRLDNGKQS